MTRTPAPLRLAADPAEASGLPGLRRSVRLATAAEALDCDPSHVRQLLRQGHLEGHRLGKRGVRVYLDSITAYQQGRPIAPAGRRAAPPAPKPRPGAAYREAMASLKAWGIL